MTEPGHRDTFYGFPGTYWDEKEKREAEEEQARIDAEVDEYRGYYGAAFDVVD